MTEHRINLDVAEKQIDYYLDRIFKNKIPSLVDLSDLRQDIFVTLLEQIDMFNPNRSSLDTFQARVIRNCVQQFSLKLRWKKNRTEEKITFVHTASLLTNKTKRNELQDVEKSVFVSEIHEVIENMDDELKLIAKNLMWYSVTQTSERMGIGINKLLRRIEKIRAIFTQAGIKPEDF